MNKDNTVYIVHCIDTEGPLYESIEDTFERINSIFKINLNPSKVMLENIQDKKIDLGDKTNEVASVFSRHNLAYNDSWDKIDGMLQRILSKKFRDMLLDSSGKGWVYNWFCLDHVGYTSNPRKRDIGFHKVYDFYTNALMRYYSLQDVIYWHFHPMSVYKEAHRCGTSLVNSPHIYESLCRRIIERRNFPAAVRAGFHAERPDSHLFLEQWIPFDFSNWAYNSDVSFKNQYGLEGGRLGDWRAAPDDWSVYQPHHDNWQLSGNCRRWIARGIDIFVRGKELTQKEVDKAFARADSGKPTLIGCVSHDFRDIAYELAYLREKISEANKKYPHVKFKFCEAAEGFQNVIYGTAFDFEPVKLKLFIIRNKDNMTLKVETVQGKVFGPQPFLAVKMKSGRFIHENFDFDPSLTKWSYTFDFDSIRADDVSTIGVAANDKYGATFVETIEL